MKIYLLYFLLHMPLWLPTSIPQFSQYCYMRSFGYFRIPCLHYVYVKGDPLLNQVVYVIVSFLLCFV